MGRNGLQNQEDSRLEINKYTYLYITWVMKMSSPLYRKRCEEIVVQNVLT